MPAGPISFGFRLDHALMERLTTPEQMAAIEAALRLWSNVANITFTEINPGGYTNEATILFGNYYNATAEEYAFANFPSANGMSFDSPRGDVWLNASKTGILAPLANSFEYLAILHEIGHALGLEHPADYTPPAGQRISYNNDALYIEDSRQYTVMSYFAASSTGANHVYQGQTIYASTPLLDDIAAIQRLYGANRSFATGDTVYGFNSNADPAFHITSSIHQVVFSIWDGGGNDTLDLSGYANSQTIDLRQGAFSDVGALSRNVSIAIGTIIENAIGGSGNDTLIGNDGANLLEGGGGNDTLTGGLESDRLAGGTGIDTFSGSLVELDGDVILDYEPGEVILVRNAQFAASAISVSNGPTVIHIDADRDGFWDATIALPSVQVANLMVTSAEGGNSTALSFFTAQPFASFAVSNSALSEGRSGISRFTFSVRLSEAQVSSQTIDWAVGGSGTHPADASDFVAGALPSGALIFAPGEILKTLTVDILGDTIPEFDEQFTVSLSYGFSGYQIDLTNLKATILDDDSVAVAHDDAYVIQQGQSFSSTVLGSLLENDLNATMVSLSSGPAHGSLQLASDGSFVYTPTAGFAGVDAFSYLASNGGSSAGAQALLHVVPVSIGATTTLNLLALTAEQQIAAIYTGFFGRGADAAGFDFWVDQFNVGLPIQGPIALFANIASSFGISDEAKARYPFLANPFGAHSAEIAAFIDSVYTNLFNRSSDLAGLNYWTGQVEQTLASGRFVGSVLIDMMSGAQNTMAGNDIASLMGKVVVSLAYVHEQKSFGTQWTSADDGPEAVALLHAVTAGPETVLTGIARAHDLVAADLG